MTTEERRVIEEAKKWWEARRPEGWDVNQHVREPTINCTTEERSRNYSTTIGEKENKALASAVSALVWKELDEHDHQGADLPLSPAMTREGV